MSDKEHMEWIYARLVNHYGENPNALYMMKFATIIQSINKGERK